MSRTDQFLEKYCELENLAKAEFHLPEDDRSPVTFLIKHRAFHDIKQDLDLCREVRNFYSHRRNMLSGHAIEPSEEMISLLDATIQRVKKPLRAMDIAIGIEQVYWRQIDDHVLPTMRIMNENSISHIPILNNGIVEGVFSDNTIMAYLLDETIIEAAGNMRFSELNKYLPLEAHKADTFRFIARDKLVTEINDIFADALAKSDRIGLVFVTAHGRKTEKLLGIITAWDLAAGGKE